VLGFDRPETPYTGTLKASPTAGDNVFDFLHREMNERKKMAKTTTHRDPIKRAARIERRTQKRLEAVMRKKLVKKMKIGASVL